MLVSNTIKVRIENLNITLPHPANFALHKLIIFQRRPKKEKAVKDSNTAIEILKALINKGEIDYIRQVFDSLLKKWQRKIIRGIEKTKEKALLDELTLR